MSNNNNVDTSIKPIKNLLDTLNKVYEEMKTYEGTNHNIETAVTHIKEALIALNF